MCFLSSQDRKYQCESFVFGGGLVRHSIIIKVTKSDAVTAEPIFGKWLYFFPIVAVLHKTYWITDLSWGHINLFFPNFWHPSTCWKSRQPQPSLGVSFYSPFPQWKPKHHHITTYFVKLKQCSPPRSVFRGFSPKSDQSAATHIKTKLLFRLKSLSHLYVSTCSRFTVVISLKQAKVSWLTWEKAAAWERDKFICITLLWTKLSHLNNWSKLRESFPFLQDSVLYSNKTTTKGFFLNENKILLHYVWME